MLMDILLVVHGIISIRFRGTGQPMPMNTDRLAEGDYDIFCPRGEFLFWEDNNEIMRNQANLIRRYQTDRRELRATSSLP
jgi:hypothetical protein